MHWWGKHAHIKDSCIPLYSSISLWLYHSLKWLQVWEWMLSSKNSVCTNYLLALSCMHSPLFLSSECVKETTFSRLLYPSLTVKFSQWETWWETGGKSGGKAREFLLPLLQVAFPAEPEPPLIPALKSQPLLLWYHLLWTALAMILTPDRQTTFLYLLVYSTKLCLMQSVIIDTSNPGEEIINPHKLIYIDLLNKAYLFSPDMFYSFKYSLYPYDTHTNIQRICQVLQFSMARFSIIWEH